MGTQDALFDVEPIVRAPEPQDSATVRRTRRQSALLGKGLHPLSSPMKYPLALHAEAAPAEDRDADGRRCGNCRFRQVMPHHDRSYPKCVAPGLIAEAYERYGPARVSNSAATDCRAWWPACRDHEWGDPKLSPDAARCVPSEAAR